MRLLCLSCPVSRGGEQKSLVDAMGLRAFTLFKHEKDGYFLYIFYVVGGFFTDNQRFCQSVSQQFQGSSGVCRYVWSESCQCIDIFVAGVGNIVYLINTVCV